MICHCLHVEPLFDHSSALAPLRAKKDCTLLSLTTRWLTHKFKNKREHVVSHFHCKCTPLPLTDWLSHGHLFHSIPFHSIRFGSVSSVIGSVQFRSIPLHYIPFIFFIFRVSEFSFSFIQFSCFTVSPIKIFPPLLEEIIIWAIWAGQKVKTLDLRRDHPKIRTVWHVPTVCWIWIPLLDYWNLWYLYVVVVV